MVSKPIYVPMVKGKENDLLGVGLLANGDRRLIKPFVEALPLDTAKASLDRHIVRFCEYLKAHLPMGEAFVDFYGVMPDAFTSDGQNAVLAGFRCLRAMGRQVTPAYGFERNDGLWGPLGELAREFGQGFCFRISRDDLESYSADETWQQVIERTSQLGLQAGEVDLVLDLRTISPEHEVKLQELVTDFLTANPAASRYRSLVLAGSSALKDVSGVEEEGVDHVRRSELHVWSRLWRDLPSSLQLAYADYGVVHPDFADGGPNKYMNAKIRYTVGDKIVYLRGHGLLWPQKDFEQYHRLASRVCGEHWFQGRPYSYGDRYISDCSNGWEKPGAPAVWVKVDMNHHVTYATRQMATLRSKLLEIESDAEAEAAISGALV